MDVHSITTLARKYRNGKHVIKIILRKTINTSHKYIDLSLLSNEEEHLMALKIILYYRCNIYYRNIVHYYVRKNYMKCLKMILAATTYVSYLIAVCGWHYCNMAALKLVALFSCFREWPIHGPYKLPIQHDTIIIWHSIVCNRSYCSLHWIKYREVQPLGQLIQGVPNRQHKLLIQFAIIHNHPFTLPLIKFIMTDSSYDKLLLLKELCIMSNLQDVYFGYMLFMFAALLYQ